MKTEIDPIKNPEPPTPEVGASLPPAIFDIDQIKQHENQNPGLPAVSPG